jgi:hypothetical protein
MDDSIFLNAAAGRLPELERSTFPVLFWVAFKGTVSWGRNGWDYVT